MKTSNFIKILFIGLLCLSFTSVSAQHHKAQRVQRQKHVKVKRHYPHYRYSKLPRWGYSYKAAPKKALRIANAGINYHYRSGIFYKPSGPNFIVVKAPLGAKVKTLPRKKIKFLHNGRKHFYYYGTYYVKSNESSEYITVAPPVGAKVDALPEGYKEVTINGNDFYELDGTLYKTITSEKGDEWYEVVGDK